MPDRKINATAFQMKTTPTSQAWISFAFDVPLYILYLQEFFVFFSIDCGSLVNNSLTSPGYPNSYPRNMYCSYSVPIPDGMAMNISFGDFEVDYHPSCTYVMLLRYPSGGFKDGFGAVNQIPKCQPYSIRYFPLPLLCLALMISWHQFLEWLENHCYSPGYRKL